ncbi:MAG TPA: hypothetical protein VGM76_18345 [Lacipirellulaceae bacterium]|jgi:hypothetical protein
MNSPTIQPDRFCRHAVANEVPTRPSLRKLEQQKQQFRAMIEPIVYRARQLGLNRVQIREIITSIL